MESTKTRALCEDLKRLNTKIFSIVGNRMQEPGIPDRYISHKLWHGWIEFKDEGTQLTEKQAYLIRELNKRQPASAFVIRFPDRIEDHEGSLMIRFVDAKDLLKRLFLLRKLLEGHWVHRSTANGCRVTRIVDERVQVSLGDDSITFWKLDDFQDSWRKL